MTTTKQTLTAVQQRADKLLQAWGALHLQDEINNNSWQPSGTVVTESVQVCIDSHDGPDCDCEMSCSCPTTTTGGVSGYSVYGDLADGTGVCTTISADRVPLLDVFAEMVAIALHAG